MAVERLKFRCYQCSQLLASAPGKAGSIVSCPRCKAELVVPAPDSANAGDTQSGPIGKASGRATSTLAPPKGPVPSYLDEVAAAIPADLADLRPEDLRVEAEFFQSLTRAHESTPARDPEPFVPEPAAPFPAVEQLPPAATVAPVPEIGRPASEPYSPESPIAAPWPAEPTPMFKPSPDVPAIEIEPPSILPPDREFRPIHEVVLPASVVLAWSVFALIGVATSFIAGLMLGHYFWKM